MRSMSLTQARQAAGTVAAAALDFSGVAAVAAVVDADVAVVVTGTGDEAMGGGAARRGSVGNSPLMMLPYM